MEFTFENDQDQVAYGATDDLRKSILMTAARLIKSIEDQLAKQIGRLPTKDDVLAAAGVAYDTYIAPIDIPGIPAAVEPWIDQMLKAVFLRLVAGAYDQLQAL